MDWKKSSQKLFYLHLLAGIWLFLISPFMLIFSPLKTENRFFDSLYLVPALLPGVGVLVTGLLLSVRKPAARATAVIFHILVLVVIFCEGFKAFATSKDAGFAGITGLIFIIALLPIAVLSFNTFQFFTQFKGTYTG